MKAREEYNSHFVEGGVLINPFLKRGAEVI